MRRQTTDARGRSRFDLALLACCGLLCAIGVVAYLAKHQSRAEHTHAAELEGPPKQAQTRLRVERRERPDEDPPQVAPPEPADAGDASLTVEVIDDAGSPIPGVALWLLGEPSMPLRRVGNTDSIGRLSLPRDTSLAPRAALVAEKPGYETETVSAQPDGDPEASPTLTIRLTKAVTIRGRVVGPDGHPRRGVSRVALRPRVAMGPATLTSSFVTLRADPRFLVKETDDEGRFELTTVRGSTQYTLLVSGGSWAGEQTVLTPSSGDMAVTVHTDTLYALSVRFVDPDGKPAPVLRGGAYLPATAFRMPPDLPGFPESFAELGLLSSLTDGRVARPRVGDDADASSVEWVFRMPSDAERIGPFPYTIRAPGWLPTSANVWAYRIDDSNRYTDVTLTPIDDRGRGAVAVEWNLSALPAPLQASLASTESLLAPILRVVLLPDETRADQVKSYSCEVWFLSNGVVATMADLPAGRYRVHLAPKVSPSTVDWAQPETLDVRAGETAVLEVRPERVGALALVGSGGATQFDAEAVAVDIEWETPSGALVSETVSVSGRRPMLPMLPPGAYTVRVRWPNGDTSQVGRVLVAADQITSAKVAPQ